VFRDELLKISEEIEKEAQLKPTVDTISLRPAKTLKLSSTLQPVHTLSGAILSSQMTLPSKLVQEDEDEEDEELPFSNPKSHFQGTIEMFSAENSFRPAGNY